MTGHTAEKHVAEALDLQQSNELDHKAKLDGVRSLRGEWVGFQITLQRDPAILAKKMALAKIHGLSWVDRLIFLVVTPGVLRCQEFRKDINQLIQNVLEQQSARAIYIAISDSADIHIHPY